ncbi:hypothetical protein AX769_08305 [Frondihabitans sp. PAMC 28766]|uniref:hypothetical protein n=1 Tax=Frondihabitans sp. PAMC 28766 TaxID=1795630 RepID=UPI00078D82B6|nr:hypothetical protein [Frondihabitans sp. PAMC 28766]AMM20169.1 hypothetical protein AX769_08305 [Frondihabitans sp. PAMC 28766]
MTDTTDRTSVDTGRSISPLSTVAMAIGTVLALTWIVLGFWAFVLVAVAMIVGSLVARVITGRLDLRAIVDVIQGKRSSK